MKPIRVALNIFAAAALLACGLAEAQVARVLRIDGAAMLDQIGQARRFLGVGEKLDEKAVITVARDSFVMLEFRDESRVTLRPNTVFRVDSYADETPEKITFGLAKGGLRAISGLIGKRKPEVVQINTTTAYIGIRGTEFDARLCDLDCEAEDRGAAPPTRSRAVIAARVVELEGISVATGSTLPSRILSPGAIIYERDSIATAPDAFLALAFPDGSRVSLGPDGVLAIQQFKFDDARAEQNGVQLRLYEGALRVATGSIAQRKPDAYRIDTAIGPIEPRTAVFDAFCSGACIDAKSNARTEMQRMKAQADRAVAQANQEAGIVQTSSKPPALAPPPKPSDGLVVHTVDGSVLVGGTEVAKGSTAIFSERGAAPRAATQTLAYIAQNKAPRPDLVTFDPGLFNQQRTQSYDPGLYVWVREGAITLNPLEQTTQAPSEPVRLAAAGTPPLGGVLRGGSGPLVVNAGQAAVITPRQIVLLPVVPNFMRLDATPLPTRGNVPVNLPFFQGKDGSTVGLCSPP